MQKANILLLGTVGTKVTQEVPTADIDPHPT